MNVELRGNQKLETALQSILHSRQEELLVGFGKLAESKAGLIFLLQDITHGNEAYIKRTWHGLEWDAELTAQWVRKAEDSHTGIVIIHAHAGVGQVGFSPTDLTTKDRILDHFSLLMPDALSGYVVIGSQDFEGEFTYRNNKHTLAAIKSVSCPLTKRQKFYLGMPTFTPSEEHDRQVRALGSEGHRLLNNSTVGLVGLGGAGSMVAQQLAHSGIGQILLIDGDKLEESNLSRVVGAYKNDIGSYKADIIRREIKKINKDAKLTLIKEYFPSPEAYKYLKDADIIISCVDKFKPKSALNVFAKRFLVPFIDVGVTIDRVGGKLMAIDGQVIKVQPDSRCMKCIGIISDAREKQDAIVGYGAGVKNPQVITYNGVLASIACGELLKIITGIAGKQPRTRHLIYDGIEGTVEKALPTDFICNDCRTQYAEGDPTYS